MEEAQHGGIAPGANLTLGAGIAAGAASREKADAFLDEQIALARKQSALADLQIEDLKREDRLRHWSLRVRHVSDVMKLGFELAVAFIVIAVAIGLGLEIWAAARADGLVIDAFNVPPALADKGLTGQVVASKLLDRLTVMQNQTQSSRAPSSFANDWTNDIKVEIPDTGVSLGEVVRYLHGALGHEMHLSGEMYQTPKGAALTVRVDNEPGQTFEASSGDINALIARAAEAVYARAQPYRYSVYLYARGDYARSYAVDEALAQGGPANERSWAYVGLTNFDLDKGLYDKARRDTVLAYEANPILPLPLLLRANVEVTAGHEEAALTTAREAAESFKGRGANQYTAKWRAYGALGAEIAQKEETGDLLDIARVMARGSWFQPVYFITEGALDFALAHDTRSASATLSTLTSRQVAGAGIDTGAANVLLVHAQIDLEHQDWPKVIAEALQSEAMARRVAAQTHGSQSDRAIREVGAGPLLALAYAHMGEQTKADAVLKTLPLDCDPCARAHGRVEAIRRHWDAATKWFALVAARSPDIPFADSDWGAMLLAKGDLGGAIAKFESANRKGPHFADPLEMWGEALIRTNRSDLAVAKFAEAAQYAPNWGRLHLKWGEALLWTGDKGGARRQFATAATLDLCAADIAALRQVEARAR